MTTVSSFETLWIEHVAWLLLSSDEGNAIPARVT